MGVDEGPRAGLGAGGRHPGMDTSRAGWWRAVWGSGWRRALLLGGCACPGPPSPPPPPAPGLQGCFRSWGDGGGSHVGLRGLVGTGPSPQELWRECCHGPERETRSPVITRAWGAVRGREAGWVAVQVESGLGGWGRGAPPVPWAGAAQEGGRHDLCWRCRCTVLAVPPCPPSPGRLPRAHFTGKETEAQEGRRGRSVIPASDPG